MPPGQVEDLRAISTEHSGVHGSSLPVRARDLAE
jgi:hypothetical protein